MKISHKLILGFLLVALLASVPFYFTMRAYRDIDAAFARLMSDPVEMIKSLESLKFAGVRIVSSTSEYGFIHNEAAESEEKPTSDEEADLISSGRKQFEESLHRYQQLIENAAGDEREYHNSIRDAGRLLIATSAEIISLKQDGVSGDEVLEKKEIFERQEQDYLKAVNDALQHEYDQLAEEQGKVQSAIAVATQKTLIVAVLTFFLAIGLGIFVSRQISRRIESLREASEKIGRGEFETSIDIGAKDEIGGLALSFNRMAEDLRTSRAEIVSAKTFTENIIGSMGDMLVITDLDLKIIQANKAAVNTTGYAESELVGRLITVLSGENILFTRRGVNKLIRIGSVQGIDQLISTRDGKARNLSLSLSIIKNPAGEPVAIACVGRDITERIKAKNELLRSNEKLRRSNRELQDFAYVASHDLQEPLRKVRAFADRLKTKYADTLADGGIDYLERMQNAAERMQTLIQDLLTFSRVMTKAQPFGKVDMSQTAKEVLSDLELKIEETGANVEIGTLPTIEADATQMRQLMQNLIGNALKFRHLDTAPIIKISAESVSSGKGRSNGSYQIKVEDNGIGFDQKYVDKIFTVFQRLHGRTEYEGSGVGLAVCRKIAERHNGQITAQGIEGKGATFVVTLPAKQTQMEENNEIQS